MQTTTSYNAPVKLQLSLGPEHVRLLQEFVETYAGPATPCSEMALSVLKHLSAIAEPSALSGHPNPLSSLQLDKEIASLSQ